MVARYPDRIRIMRINQHRGDVMWFTSKRFKELVKDYDALVVEYNQLRARRILEKNRYKKSLTSLEAQVSKVSKSNMISISWFSFSAHS